MYFAVVDKASGKVAGRQTLMRIQAAQGVVETGHIFWSSIIARKPASTEAFFLFARYVFEDLGYRRFEWKCNDLNAPSRHAAMRLGFSYEGLFRQHMIVKGRNRDTAWFAMLDSEWPARRAAFETWLAPGNFDANGRQRISLGELMGAGGLG